MISIRSRKYGKDRMVKLSARIKDSHHDNAVALGISVTTTRWQLIDQTIKDALASSARGASFFIEDNLALQLFQLVKELTAFQQQGLLSDKIVTDSIRKNLHKDEVAIIEEKKEADTVKPTFTAFVKQYIKDCEDGVRLKQNSTRKINHGTIKGYKVLLKHLKAYQEEKKCVIDWDDITLDFYNDLRQYFLDKKYNPNTIATHMKRIKTFLGAAKLLHLTTNDDFMSRRWTVSYEEADNIYINASRLKEMASIDLMNEKAMIARLKKFARPDEISTLKVELQKETYRKKLSEVRDVFVLGCLVGQRVSDYKRITRSMLETIVGDRTFLHLVQTKTGKDVYIPYNKLMDDILSRYDGEMPKLFDQYINKYIKVVGLLLGWTEPAGLTERKGLMSYQSDKRFCDAIMTHTARRSFATNAYKAGVPLSAIMAITGHSTEEMLKRYLKLDSKERALLAAAEFDKVAL